MNSFERSLEDMQGKLFELSGERGYDSASFIKAFMTSQIAADLDSDFDFMHWCGKEYIMARIEDELSASLKKDGEVYDGDTLYWIGYLYRAWHFYTGESSKAIHKQAPAKELNSLFLAYHCMDVKMAIDRLKEER